MATAVWALPTDARSATDGSDKSWDIRRAGELTKGRLQHDSISESKCGLTETISLCA